MKIHVSLSFHELKLDELDVFAAEIRDGVFGHNPPFTAPPILQPAFQILINNYIDTRAAYLQGGLGQKGAFLAAKATLMTALDQMAEYVDDIADGNANIITDAHFVPTKGESTEVPAPAQPPIPEVERGATSEMRAECLVVAGALYYGCIVVSNEPLPPGFAINASGQIFLMSEASPGPPPPSITPVFVETVVDFTKSRKKRFVGLTPHITYYFYFFAANASGVSPLSDPRGLECL